MKMQVKLRQPLVPALIAILLGLQYNEPTRAYMILLIALGGIFVISFLWAWSIGRGLLFHRETPLNWVQVGDQVEEQLTLVNTSLFPAPYVEFIDRSSIPGYKAHRITSISSRDVDEWSSTAFFKQRGLFSFGDAQIITSDPVGMFEVVTHAPLQTPILVLPQPSVLPEFNIASSGMLGEGQPRRETSQQSMHVSSVREFAEGDSWRQIHWPTTARKNKTFVRLMENAPEGNWWVILDLDQNYMRGDGWDSIEEQSVSLAASLADRGLRGRKSTGLISNGLEFSWLPPQKGDAQSLEILQALARAKPGALSLAGMFDKMSISLGSHHSLLIITACTQVGWMKSIPTLVKHGLIPTVFLMDGSSFEGAESMELAATTLAMQKVPYQIVPRGFIQAPQMNPIPVEPWTGNITQPTRVAEVKNS